MSVFTMFDYNGTGYQCKQDDIIKDHPMQRLEVLRLKNDTVLVNAKTRVFVSYTGTIRIYNNVVGEGKVELFLTFDDGYLKSVTNGLVSSGCIRL